MPYFELRAMQYEGPKRTNSFSFKYYNSDEIVMGKTMKEQRRFAMSYWHIFTYMGRDPFGSDTVLRPWDVTNDEMKKAIERVYAAFEFMEKCQISFFCFHDAKFVHGAGTSCNATVFAYTASCNKW